MKNKIMFTVLLSCLFIFISCGNVPEADISQASTAVDVLSGVEASTDRAEAEKEVEIPDEPVYVSPLSAENFLVPLENYSWEREFTAEYVVLHFTSAVVPCRNAPYDIGNVRKIFEENEISIHYIIDRNGLIQCYIPENRAAWHAGRGSFAGDERLVNAMNKYSIGIEIVAIGSKGDMAQYLTGAEYDALPDEIIGFTDGQYASLGLLVKDICERNGIPFDRQHVIGHQEYNPAKSDPGELFSWNKLFVE